MLLSLIFLTTALAAPPEGVVACVRATHGGPRQVCLVDPRTRELRRIGPGPADGPPVWSPGGERLAFTVAAAEGRQIAVYDLATESLQALPSGFPVVEQPDWSPDGRRLAYLAAPAEDAPRLAVVQSLEDGGESIWAAGAEGILQVEWMPSMDMILYLESTELLQEAGIDTLRFQTEGAEQGLLVGTMRDAEGPAPHTGEIFVASETQLLLVLPLIYRENRQYSEYKVRPDSGGRRLAYESNDGGDREIFLLGKRSIINLSNHFTADWNPVWSPENRYIAFESFRGGRRGVYRVFPDTAYVRTVAAYDDFDCWAPTWESDDEWIAMTANPGGSVGVFMAPAEGGPLQQLTPADAAYYAPAWQTEVEVD